MNPRHNKDSLQTTRIWETGPWTHAFTSRDEGFPCALSGTASPSPHVCVCAVGTRPTPPSAGCICEELVNDTFGRALSSVKRLGGDRTMEMVGMMASQTSCWQSPWRELGTRKSQVWVQGCREKEFPHSFTPPCSSPTSCLYLGLDVIQRKGDRGCSREVPRSSQTTASVSQCLLCQGRT